MMGRLLTGLHRGALCAHAAQQANSMGILSNAETTGVAFVVDLLFLNGKYILTCDYSVLHRMKHYVLNIN